MINIMIFFIGAIGYGLLEILWRGYTHSSMLITGGICLVIIRLISIYFKNHSIIKKGILASLSITAIEFITGVIVNIKLNLNVWDYSNQPYNIDGQVCLLYTFLWFILSMILIWAIDYIRTKKHGVF